MAKFRILIVDDQHEVRRTLSTGLRTLGTEFDVVELPSAEEALLEATRRPIDLLVTDVRLPGMSGLDLMVRIRKRNPDLKIILITGLTESKIRRQVAEAGADAFFYKPIEMADFLDAVERCLGLVKTMFPAAPIVAEEKPAAAGETIELPQMTLSERLSGLHVLLSAQAVVLLDEQAQIQAQAGELPTGLAVDDLLAALLPVLGASSRVTPLLGQSVPETLFYLGGANYNLWLAHVGQSQSLLIATRKQTTVKSLPEISLAVLPAAKEIAALLTEQKEPTALAADEELFATPLEMPAAEAPVVEETPASAEDLAALDALFGGAKPALQTTDLDSFWDTAAEQSGSAVLNADTITFEQAQKLGLTPDKEKES
jgi:CheY-like chemotaxis protein